jgi:rhodanese-related sulfurtransferase
MAHHTRRRHTLTTSQIILYGLLALIILFYLRRFLVTRTIKRYTATQLADRLKEPGSVLLDVRTSSERQAQHIPGSLHIPLQELQRRSAELEKHKNREVICYCQTGNRSIVAAVRLRRLGFNVADLEGGIAEWQFTQHAKGRR